MEVVVGEEATAVRGALERAVLARLVAKVNDVVAIDTLLDQLWPDTDPTAAVRSLRARVSRLRRLLNGTGVELGAVPGGFTLTADADDIDLLRYRRLVERAIATPLAADRLSTLDEAVRVRRSPPLSEFAYDDFARHLIQADEEMSAMVVDLRGEALIEVGRAESSIPMLSVEFEDRPGREPLARALMKALAVSGYTGRALDVFHQLRAALAERGLEPSTETCQVEEAILLGQLDGASFDAADALPLRETLYGRSKEGAAVVDLLNSHRVVTLLGPAGVGKTAVAVELGHELSDQFDWVAFVDGAPVTDAEQLVSAVMAVLPGTATASTPVDTVVARLRHRRSLLILDNCEHLVAQARELVSLLLSRVDHCQILATSRTPLGVPGEQRFPLRPLPVPGTSHDLAALESVASVELFLARTKSIQPDFLLDHDNARAVADLCRVLEGLPLAIELAAARTNVLSPDQIVDRIDEKLQLLVDDAGRRPPHQRSLQAAIEWSVGLLSERSCSLFPRLSVLRGSFDLEAVLAVAGPRDEIDVIASIGEIEEHSLVEVDHTTGRLRYRLLESVRLIAASFLSDEQRLEAESQHARHYHDRVVAAFADTEPTETFQRMKDLDDDLANVRAAIATSTSTQPALAADLLGEVWRWWHHRGHWDEGATAVLRLLDSAPSLEPELRHRLLDAATRFLLFSDSEDRRLVELLDQQDQVAAVLGLDPNLRVRGLLHRISGEYEAAARLHRTEAELDRAAGRSARAALANLAVALLSQGHYPDAGRAAEEARDEAIAHGEAGPHDTTPVTLAQLSLLEGDPALASTLAAGWFEEAAKANVDLGFQLYALGVHVLAECALDHPAAARRGLATLLQLATDTSQHTRYVLLAAARVAMANKDMDTAVRLAGGSDTVSGDILMPEYKAVEREIAVAVGPSYTELWEQGRLMDLTDLLRLAYGAAAPVPLRVK